jgi:hypothetical protein
MQHIGPLRVLPLRLQYRASTLEIQKVLMLDSGRPSLLISWKTQTQFVLSRRRNAHNSRTFFCAKTVQKQCTAYKT